MPKYLLPNGLPDYPAGMDQKSTALVAPIYRALGTLTQNVASAIGKVQYTADEQAGLNPFTYMLNVRPNTVLATATVDLPFGTLVNLFVSGTVVSAKKATNADMTTPAHGVVATVGGVLAGQRVEITFMQGICTGVSGTVFGAQYWLGTDGVMQNTAPTTAGQNKQPVAIGLGSVGVYLNIPTMGTVV